MIERIIRPNVSVRTSVAERTELFMYTHSIDRTVSNFHTFTQVNREFFYTAPGTS